jgi:hypothetical protein
LVWFVPETFRGASAFPAGGTAVGPVQAEVESVVSKRTRVKNVVRILRVYIYGFFGRGLCTGYLTSYEPPIQT